MAQFKTLQFPNTPGGQAKKVRALQVEASQGWRVISETIIPGRFKGGKACCLFLIFAPCAFLAGSTDGAISVTLQRDDDRSYREGLRLLGDRSRSTGVSTQPKWSALLQYDKEVASAADQVKDLGPGWMDELAAAFLALNDKAYLPKIVEELKARAAREAAPENKPIALLNDVRPSRSQNSKFAFRTVVGLIIASLVGMTAVVAFLQTAERASPQQSEPHQVAGSKQISEPSTYAPHETETPAPSVVSPPPAPSFIDGQKDRQAWEDWFGSLSGDFRAGANYWAAHRNQAKTSSCNALSNLGGGQVAGCQAARTKLAATDARRHKDADYRIGWNSIPSPAISQPQ